MKYIITNFTIAGIWLLAFACGSPEKPGESMPMIDLRDYRPPTAKLVEGQVFCYRDNTGQVKKYEKVQLSIMGDTVLTSTEYDSAGQVSTIEKIAFQGDNYLFLHGEVTGIPIEIDPVPITWRQPVNIDSSGYRVNGKIAFGTIEAKFKQVGFYRDLKDSALANGYPLADCILQTLSSKMETSVELTTGDKQLSTILRVVLAKGVGKVYETHEVPGQPAETFYLSDVISIPAFDARFPGVSK